MRSELKVSLSSLDEEIRIACEASGISYKDAAEEFENFFKHVKILVEDERLPDVSLSELGTFKSTQSSILTMVKRLKNQIKFGRITRDDLKKIIKKIWYPYKRIVDYKNGSGGVINNKVGVGYFWLYVPMKFTQILFPEDKKIEDETGSR